MNRAAWKPSGFAIHQRAKPRLHRSAEFLPLVEDVALLERIAVQIV